jgi:hypothetical protein
MLRGSIFMHSVRNPSVAGTQRRQALQGFPVILAGMTACEITGKRWSVEARLDTTAFLTWRDCPWLVRQWCVAAMAIVKVLAGVRGQFLQKAPPRKNSIFSVPSWQDSASLREFATALRD